MSQPTLRQLRAPALAAGPVLIVRLLPVTFFNSLREPRSVALVCPLHVYLCRYATACTVPKRAGCSSGRAAAPRREWVRVAARSTSRRRGVRTKAALLAHQLQSPGAYTARCWAMRAPAQLRAWSLRLAPEPGSLRRRYRRAARSALARTRCTEAHGGRSGDGMTAGSQAAPRIGPKPSARGPDAPVECTVVMRRARRAVCTSKSSLLTAIHAKPQHLHRSAHRALRCGGAAPRVRAWVRHASTDVMDVMRRCCTFDALAMCCTTWRDSAPAASSSIN